MAGRAGGAHRASPRAARSWAAVGVAMDQGRGDRGAGARLPAHLPLLAPFKTGDIYFTPEILEYHS